MSGRTFSELSAPQPWGGGLPHHGGCGWLDGLYKQQIGYQCGVPTHQEMYHHRPPPVPEPTTTLLLAFGLVAVYLFKRSRT